MKSFWRALILVLFLVNFIIPFAAAEEIQTGVDATTRQDKVLLHGRLLQFNLQERAITLEEVGPLCRGRRTFYIRNQDPRVQLAKGNEIRFWLIGNCGTEHDVIDIVQNQ